MRREKKGRKQSPPHEEKTLAMWQNWHEDPEKHCRVLWEYMDQGADGYGLWDAARRLPEKAGNFWDWGRWPRPSFDLPNRLVGRYQIFRWDGYRMNRHTPAESW